MTTEKQPIQSQYADLLNQLDQMSESIAYAARKQVLLDAQHAILALEQDVKSAHLDADTRFSQAMENGRFAGELRVQLERAAQDILALRAQLNFPEVNDFVQGVQREAAHQRQRWGIDDDAGKTDADWFWLVGYLAGKALHKPEKQLHHLIACAAAIANWHLARLGKTNMRPGIGHLEGELSDEP